ncbi:timeless protein-domain-containing protein [Mortierella sp. GBAus27b]|nr:timeless protein-domain-containing protein [Mortierella sp. GBAus27b]
MDPDTESLLVSTCMALGGFEDVSEDMNDATQVYVMGDECLECLKDIKKFIKYFDEPGDNIVLTYLGNMGILEKDLIPIMLLNTPSNSPARERLVLACIELMVPMTWVIDYQALREIVVTEEDTSIVGNLHQRLEILRGYKRAFLQPGVLKAVFSVMLKPLGVEYRLRTARDQAVIRLGLSLFRNLVAITDVEATVSGTMDQFISSIMQEELLERFQKDHILDLFATLASSASDGQLSEWNVLTLETLYYIFEGIDPDDLIPPLSGRVRNTQLQELLQKEEREKKTQMTAGMKRHDRFGTTSEVRLQDGTRVVMHKKGSLFASFENHLDNVKKARARPKRQKELDEGKKNVSRSGLVLLRTLALTLLESGFNPLFTSLRRDMEASKDKIRVHHKSQFMTLMGFMLNFQRQYVDYLARQYNEQKKGALPLQLEELEKEYQENLLRCDFDLIITGIEVPTVYQVIEMVRANFELKDKDKQWDVTRKGVNCIQEILATLYVMNKSQNEEYRDASAHVQNNLYYEEGTLELFVDLTKRYRTQSIRYLHAVVKLVHILLKTLEGYSNSKSYMFVRKKKAIKKPKAKDADGDQKSSENADQSQAGNEGGNPTENTQENGDNDQERNDDSEDDENGDTPAYTMKEHKFHFEEFERRFAHEAVVNTYCTFLEDFGNLDETQFHWAASLFHRIAVNCKNPAVFYKMSTLQLFHRILQSNQEDAKKEMVPFISYILHQFFKKLQEYPLLMVETVFPKSSQACKDINLGRDAVEEEKMVVTAKKQKRLMNTELQVNQELTESEQIKVAIMALVDDDDDDLVAWTIELLKDTVAKRQLMQFRSESELEENPDLMFSVQNVEDISITAAYPTKQEVIRLNPRLRLLFKLLKFVKEEVGDDISYIVPKDLPTDTIAEYQELVETIYKDIDKGENYDFAGLIQKINKTGSGSKGSGRSSGAGARHRVEKEIPVYHSSEYILDSDSDDDGYYEREKNLREQVNVEYAEAEDAKRKMDEEHARIKTIKQKEMLLKKVASRKKKKNEEKAATRSQEKGRGHDKDNDHGDNDNHDDGDDDEDEQDSIRKPPKTSSDIDDSDDNDQESAKKPKSSQKNGTSNAERNGHSKSSQSATISPPRPTPARRMIRLDSDDSDSEDDAQGGKQDATTTIAVADDEEDEDEESTRPLSLTQRLAHTSVKRRIILDDSEDEDTAMEGTQRSPGTDDRPAKKRITMEEDDNE